MIKHTAVFRLKHPKGSADEASFIAAAHELGSIVGVHDLDVLRQTSDKAPYTFCLTMNFASQAAYDASMDHPEHVTFTRERRDSEVVAFMILDYEPLGRSPIARPRPGSAR